MKRILLLILVLGGVLAASMFLKSEKSVPSVQENAENASIDGASLLTETYTDPEFGYSIKFPAGYKIESEGRYSKIFLPDSTNEGVGPANFIYISVVTPDMRASEGEIYNYGSSHFNKLIAVESVGDSVNLADNVLELGEWYTYTLVAIEDIDSGKVKNFQNNKPWEFPGGTVENRFIYQTASNIYILGYYVGGDTVAEKSKLDPRVAYSMIKSFKILR